MVPYPCRNAQTIATFAVDQSQIHFKMLRTHHCGELRIADINTTVTLCGWIQRIRDKGGMVWIDLRDRYGITQLVFDESKCAPELIEIVRKIGREHVVQVTGKVIERFAKNDKLPTGDIEVEVAEINALNPSKTPPFTIEEHTDGGDDLRMQFRYLDLRRPQLQRSIMLRHRMLQETRKYLDSQGFLEIETPFLIKSTPEGARDFVVPSRMNPTEFYALPQSPQTFKQLLMVSGFDKYFQIVRCFRDEDLRADRQPEFTQIDCEMSFVTREDILSTFEGMVRHLFRTVLDYELGEVVRMSYEEAIRNYGTDKPDLRFDMRFVELNDLAKGQGFKVFDSAELVAGIRVQGGADFSRKKIDALTEYVQRPQIGAGGIVYVKYNEDGTVRSSVDKFFSEKQLHAWVHAAGAEKGDMLLILAGEARRTRNALSELRLKIGKEMGLATPGVYKALWVLDFPLLEWDEETHRYHAMHHPFTSPTAEDHSKLETDPAGVRANAYDMVVNGVEVGGGSIRIHDKTTQQQMFSVLGFSEEEARKQFGFLMDAFEYGAPPHGGIAYGFDRLCALFGGFDSIRDVIAFPKNNAGRDVMINTPSSISVEQFEELHLRPLESNEGSGISS
jgi:aspartyl-tRNA synthetase